MDITDIELVHDRLVRLRFADGVEKSIDLDPDFCDQVFAEIRSGAPVLASVKVEAGAGTIVLAQRRRPRSGRAR